MVQEETYHLYTLEILKKNFFFFQTFYEKILAHLL